MTSRLYDLIAILIALTLLSGCAREPQSPEIATTADGIDVVSGPGTNYDDLFTVAANQQVQLVGQRNNCDWFKILTADQQEGWVSAVVLILPSDKSCATIPLGTYRPQTQILQGPSGDSGQGELEIDNGALTDGIVILTAMDESVIASAYIRDGDNVKMSNIPDGTYYLFFSAGDAWDGNGFTKHPTYQRFEETFPFTTTGLNYSVWSVTLHPVAGGNTATESVNPGQFPSATND